MIKYIEAIEQLPIDIKLPLMKAFELFREEIAETVKKSDFNELKTVVLQLAEAQKRTEQKVEELAEAQKKTEQRLDSLSIKVEELVEAQKRTEQKVEELAEAQKRTEQKVEELAEAQKKTEEAMAKLTLSQKEIREQIGGLSHTIGYRLEDESYKALPSLLKRDIGVDFIEKIKRDYIEIAPDKYIEVNIWGRCRKGQKEYILIGEAKTQLKKKDIDNFIKTADRIKKHIDKKQIRVLVTYQASPQVQKYAKEKDVRLYFSYEF